MTWQQPNGRLVIMRATPDRKLTAMYVMIQLKLQFQSLECEVCVWHNAILVRQCEGPAANSLCAYGHWQRTPKLDQGLSESLLIAEEIEDKSWKGSILCHEFGYIMTNGDHL